MTTIKFFGGDLGGETMLVRCDLTQAAAPIQVDYDNEGWTHCHYQCADTGHRRAGLVEIGKEIAARAVGIKAEEFDCEWEEVQ